MGVRVLVDGTWGFASTSDCSAAAIRRAVDTASASAKSSASFRKAKIPHLPAESLAVGEFAEPGVEEVLARPMAEKLQMAAEQSIELLRNISHELRSPLARIRVAVELARNKTGELSEFERLENEAEHLDSLIGKILNYTKLQTNTKKEKKIIDILDLVNEVIANVNYEFKEEKVLLKTKNEPIRIECYPGPLTSAIENVIRNAAMHSPKKKTVSTFIYKHNKEVEILVKDSGLGVDDKDLQKLFDPFFRTEFSKKQISNKGTGLGLAIAHRAIKLHNGTLTARNRDKEGLAVKMKIPNKRN